MAAGYATALRNSMLQALADAINAGAGAGTIKIYTAARPATGAAVGGATLLATLTFSDPAQSGIAAGVLTFAAVTSDASADATGTAAWARIESSTPGFVADISVSATGGGGDLQLNTTSIVTGGTVSINTGGTVTNGMP
jgi:hypothetical protein